MIMPYLVNVYQHKFMSTLILWYAYTPVFTNIQLDRFVKYTVIIGVTGLLFMFYTDKYA